MSDVSVVAAEVLPAADTIIDKSRNFGATVTAGQTVYLDTATDTWKLADCNLSAAASMLAGLAMNGGGAGQPAAIAIAGTIDPGFAVTAGTIYVLSATAGGIAPSTDLTTGWRTAILGVGLTTSSLGLKIYATGVAG